MARPVRLVVRIYIFIVSCFVAVLAVGVGFVMITKPSSDPLNLAPPPVQVSDILHARDPGERAKALSAIPGQLSVYDPQGRLIGSTRQPPIPPLDDAHLQALQRNGIAWVDHGRVATPLVENGQVVAYGLFNLGPPPVPRGLIICAIAVICMALLLCSLIFARSLARPLRKLEIAASAFGQGQHDVRVRATSSDEIGAVGNAFDTMADRVTTLVRSHRELMANVAHELRTPMARIRLALDIANTGKGEVATKMLTEIEDDIGELERLVQDVLTSARLDLAETPLQLAYVEVRQLLSEVAERSRSLDAAHEVVIDVDDMVPVIRADPGLLRRVLDNLLSNARAYSDAGSKVTLRATSTDRTLCIEVADEGIGIDEASLSRVFEPFFRAAASRGRAVGGAGLGLSLSKKIVDAHGGAMSISSIAGRGTTVRIELDR